MTAFFMAWQMFLWIPCPCSRWDESKRKEMLLWFPVIGLIIGALWYGIFVLFTLVLKASFITAALFAVMPWLLTGFMHLDGFMDCSDAALYFGNREKKLQILRDSHCGSFAVVSMSVLALLQFAACMQIFERNLSLRDALILILIPALTRLNSVDAIFRFNALERSSYEGLRGSISGFVRNVPLICFAALLAAGFFIGSFRWVLIILTGSLVNRLLTIWLVNNLKGMSGDVSGAAITAGELVFLIVLAFS